MEDWIVVPNRTYTGLPMGYTVKEGIEYIRDIREDEQEQAKHVNPATNTPRMSRSKPNKIDVKQFKRNRL